MTPDEFQARFGFAPEQDALDRVVCPLAGTLGHLMCGVCEMHNLPRFACGCVAFAPVFLIGCQEDDPEREAIPGSVARPCFECFRPTMFSPASLARPEASHPLTRFICINCANLEGLHVSPRSPAQQAEILAAKARR